MTEIPQWALDRALDRATPEGTGRGSSKSDGHYYSAMHKAFARYISEHEEPPVDPVEAAVSDLLPNADMHPLEVVIRTALRRGIEIGKGGCQDV